MNKQPIRSFSLILFCIVSMLSVLSCSEKSKVKKSSLQKSTPSKPLTLVQLTTISWNQIYEQLNLSGQLEGINPIHIYPDIGVSGIVRNKKIQVGSQVSKGMKLMEIDREAVSGNSYRHSIVQSKIAGTVSDNYVENGDMVNAGTKLFRIVQISRVKLVLHISEKDVAKVRLGQKADIVFQSYPETVFKARLTKLAPEINPRTLTLSGEIILKNTQRKLKPGMFAQIKLFLQQRQGILIPLNAIILQDNIRYVYIYNSETQMVSRRNIITGQYYDKNIEVIKGVKPGEQLVVEGQYQVLDREKVDIYNSSSFQEKTTN